MTATSRENAITTPTRNASSIHPAWKSYWYEQHHIPYSSFSQQSQVYSSYAHGYEASPIARSPYAYPSSPSAPAHYNHSYYPRDEYYSQNRNQVNSHEHEAYPHATSSYVYPSSPPPLHTHSYYLDDQYRSPTYANYQHIPQAEYNSPSRVYSYLPPSYYNGTPLKRQPLSSPRCVCGNVHTAYSPTKVGAPFHSPINANKKDSKKSRTISSSKSKKVLTKLETKKKKHTGGKMRSTAKAADRKKQTNGNMRCTAKAADRKKQTDGKMRSLTKVADRKKQTDHGKMRSAAKAAVKKEIQKLKKDSNFKVSKDEVERLEDAYILSRATKSCENISKPTTDTSKVSEIYTSFEKKIEKMSNGKKRRLKIKLRIQLLEAEKQKKNLEVQRQNQFREERLKRRREIASLPADELEKRMQPQPKQKEAISKKEKTKDVEDKIEERELTEYEKLRLQKIKRNENRLKELGLLNWKVN